MILVVGAVLAGLVAVPGAFADTVPQTLPLSQTWSDQSLITRNDDWSRVPGIIGYRGDDMVSTENVDLRSITADGSTTPVDVNANNTNPNAFNAGGVTEFHLPSGGAVVAVQGSVTANAPHLVFNLNTTGHKDVVVAYALRDLDAGTNNALQPVAMQYRVGTTGPYTNVLRGFVADATAGPNQVKTTQVSATLPANANDAAHVQVRLITANASGQDEWIGVEQLSLTGTSLNSSPVSNNDSYSVNEDTNLTIASPGVLQNDSDVDNNTLTVASPRPVSGPSNGTLTLNANGSFSYTPDANFTGSDSFTYKANDGTADGDTTRVDITVDPVNDAPAVDLNGGAAGTGYAATFAEDDGPVAIVGPTALSVVDVDDVAIDRATVTLTNHPDGSAEGLQVDTTGTTIDADYDPATGLLSLTGPAPKADYETVLRTVRYENTSQTPDGAERLVEFTANDGDLTSEVARSTVSVAAANDAPVVSVPGARTTDEDTPLVFSGANKLSVSDADAGSNAVEATLESTNGTFTMGSTAGLTFSMGDGTGDIKAVFRGTVADVNAALDGLSYAPAADYNGPAQLTITTDDLGNTGTGGPGTDADSVQITVNPVNDAPTISAVEDQTIGEDGATGQLAFTVADVETSAANLTVNASSNNTGLVPNENIAVVCNAGACTVKVTPAPNRSGTATITLTVTDAGGATRTETFVVTVEPVNDAPEAHADGYSTSEDTTLTVGVAGGVLSNDTDTENSNLTAELVSGPQSGTLDLEDDGSFTYDPAPNRNGDLTFSYRVRDAGGAVSEPATVTISVGAVNDAPDARDDAGVEADEDGTVNFDPRANDTDPEDDSLNITAFSTPQHGTVTKNGDGTLRYVPDADYEGPDSFTYTVSDGNGGTDTATVNVTVKALNDTPVAEDDAASTDEDRSVVVDVLANDRDADGNSDLNPASVRVVSGPANGSTSVNDQTGEITYNPNADYDGADEFTYEVCDRNEPPACSDPARVTVTISSVNDAPTATDRTFDAVEDTTLTVSAADGVLRDASDADGDPLAAELVTGVPESAGDLNLAPDGSFEFVPEGDFNGDVTFTFRACDAATPQACSETRTVTLRVAPRNDAPQAQDRSVSTPEDTERKITLTATDVDGDGVTFRVPQGSGPAHGSLDEIGTVDCAGASPRTCTAEVNYTPNADYHGPDSFEYVADDGDAASAPASVDIDVTPVNDAPAADDDAYSTTEDTTLTVSAADGVLKGDDDADGDALTAELVSGPGSGTLDLRGDGSFTYDPAPNFAGDVTFSYRALDGKGGVSDPATVTISVDAQNELPTVDLNGGAAGTDDDASFVEDSGPVVIDGGSDASVADPDDANMEGARVRITNLLDAGKEFLSAEAGQTGIDVSYDAATGVLSLSGPATKAQYEDVLRSVRYENTSHDPSTADRRIDFMVNDGEADSNVATSVVSVAGRNDAPTAADDAYETDEDTPLAISIGNGVLANDTDVENGGVLSAAIVDGPAHGTLAFNADGSFEYTPNDDFNGEDNFTYRASDNDIEGNLATVNLRVKPLNDAPVAGDDDYTVDEDSRLTVTDVNGLLRNDNDADGDRLTVSLERGPEHGTVTVNPDGSFEYAADADYNGTDTFTYAIADGNGGTKTATVTINVAPVGDAPVGKTDAYETDEDVTLRVGAPEGLLKNDGDVDGEAISARRVVTNPAHGTLTLSPDGSFEYVPEAGYSGDDSFEYEVCDEADKCAEPVSVSITINPVNEVPSATGDSYDAAENTLLEVSAQDGVLENDTDSDPLVAVLIQGPDSSKGTLTLRPDGSFTFQPASGFDGTVTFTYKACEEANPNVCSEPVTVTVDVAASDGAPVVRDDSGSTDEAAAVSNAYISQYASTKASTPTRLYQFNTTQSTYTLDKRGSDMARPMNAIGYRSTDLSLYGYRITKQPGIMKVNPQTGAARYLGKPSGLPTSVGYIAGDVSPDGSTYYLYANKTRVLWKVDLATFKATSIKLSSAMSVADLAVSPTDGNLYGVGKNGKLLRVNPQTGQVTAGRVTGLEAGTYGAAWFTAQGDLLVYENGTSRTNGMLVWLTDPATAPSVLSTKAGPYTKGNDGAANVANPDQTGLSVAINVLANDENPDGALDRSSLRIVQQPVHGTVTINADKTITYTSGSSYSGTDSYRYEVCDSGATRQCGTATVNITSAPAAASESPASGREEETP